jgi:hypothetical protein
MRRKRSLSEDQFDLTADIAKAEEFEKQRDVLQRAADSAGKLDTIQERVAWVLNHYPETRNSDKPLWFRYWSIFESEHWDGRSVSLDDAYKLTPPNSLSRARAKIQNDYKLFLADPEIRRRRGKLEEEERDKAVSQVAPVPLFAVYADESGKNAEHLIVGSLWFLHAPEIIKMRQDIERLKLRSGFKGELHFREIDERNLDFYLQVADLIADAGNAVSFKAISVERRGIGRVDIALDDLFYHLLLRGVEHEHDTGRAPLPRRLSLTKDLEEVGRDKIFLANLHDRISQAGVSRFGGQLLAADFIPVDSGDHQLVQVADLYTGSINRRVNSPADGAKDSFAAHFLARLGTPEGPQQTESIGDLAVHIAL